MAKMRSWMTDEPSIFICKSQQIISDNIKWYSSLSVCPSVCVSNPMGLFNDDVGILYTNSSYPICLDYFLIN